MSGYIKKVGTTPVRGNGFIIDSFHTNDNKEFNAPSLRAVEDRTDNNLLLCSDFENLPTGGFEVCGWRTYNATGYSGSPASFSPISGLFVPGGYNGILRSPQYCDFNMGNFDRNAHYSITIIFEQGGTTYNCCINDVSEAVHPVADETFADILRVVIGSFYSGGSFILSIINLSNTPLFIKAVKLEKGSSCTELKAIGKEYGIYDLVKSFFKNKFAVLSGTFTTNSNGEASAFLSFPSGFSKDNCVVMSVGISDKIGAYNYYKVGSDKTSTREYVKLDDNYVYVFFQGTSTDANAELNYKVVLYSL